MLIAFDPRKVKISFVNTRQIIKHLSNRNGLTISLYLPVDPGDSKKDWLTKVHSHLRDLRHSAKNLQHKEEKYLDAIISQVEDFLQNFDTRGTRTLALFAGKDIFESVKLPVVLSSRVHVENKPILSPLTEALDENPPYIIVLIDRTYGEIIEVNFLEEEAASKVIKSYVPQRILAKGYDIGREDKTLRHIEDHLHRHLVKIVKLLSNFESSYPNGLIVIGGQKELVGKFTRLLHPSLQKKIVGSFGANVDDNKTELIKKAQKFVDNYLEKKAWGKA